MRTLTRTAATLRSVAATSATLPAATLLAVALLAVTAGCGAAPAGEVAPPRTAGPAPASSSPGPAPASPAQPNTVQPSPGTPVPIAVPAGMTAGIAVYDRQGGAFVVQQQATHRFRSASLVKLLIALDYLWDRGPGYGIPAADRGRMDAMLRGSDDSAATTLWKSRGQREVVIRMVSRLGLPDTAPPPAAKPGFWGFTEISAADLVRIYRYLLETAPPPVRDYVMDNLHRSTKCATDRYDQSFGIPTAFRPPWAAKQGWSGFGDRPARPCTTGTTASLPAPEASPAGGVVAPAAVDMLGEVLHTTGTVGEGDRTIIAVLTVHRDGTPFADAATRLTALTRALPLP